MGKQRYTGGCPKKKLTAACDALGIGLEDLEKVRMGYLKNLTLDIVQDRLETSAAELKPREIKAFVDFMNTQEAEDTEAESDEQEVYDPLKDLVED